MMNKIYLCSLLCVGLAVCSPAADVEEEFAFSEITNKAAAVYNYQLQSQVVAEGLCSPRGLTVDRNHLFIAEAGTGGSSPCWDNDGVSFNICYGETGRVSRFNLITKTSKVVLSGLFSVHENGQTPDDSANAMGPSGLLVDGKNRYIIFNNPATYSTPEAILEAGFTKAYQAGAIHRVASNGELQLVAKVYPPEFAEGGNYDGGDLNSNPFSGVVYNGNIFLADSGANAVVKVVGDTVQPTWVLPQHSRPCLEAFGPCANGPIAPFCCGFFGEGDMSPYMTQAVPTSLVRRPRHAELYLAELTGIFWNSNAAAIHRLDANTGEVLEYEFLTGFTSIYGITFATSRILLVLELNIFGGLGEDANRLWAVDVVTKERVRIYAPELAGATAITVAHGKIYIANNAIDFPNGQCVSTLLEARVIVQMETSA